MKKKNILIPVIISLIIIIVVILFDFLLTRNKIEVFSDFVDKMSDKFVTVLDNEQLGGNLKMEVDVEDSLYGNKIVSDAFYLGDYNLDFKNDIISFYGDFNYRDNKLVSNIYIENNILYIKASDVYNKYVSFDINNIVNLEHSYDLKNIISILSEETIKISSKKNYEVVKVKYNKKKVNKLTFSFKDNYSKFKNKLVSNLISNTLFVTSVANYKKISEKEAIKYIKKFDFKNYKFILYVSDGNDFIGFDAYMEDVDVKINFNDNKYSLKYYLRDGLLYDCNFKLENGKLVELNIQDIIYQIRYNFKILNYSILYNEEVIGEIEIDNEDVIWYNDLNDNVKGIMKENFIIRDMYNNYLNRYKPNKIEPESDKEIDSLDIPRE